MTMLLERIHRAASARSMTNNSQDAASVGASVGTFEFEMDVVRDSQQQRQKRRGRRSILGVGIIDHCDSSADDQKSHEELTSMKEDHDSNYPHRKKGSHSTEHDASDRSFSFQTNSTGSSSGLSSILPNRTISLSMIIGLLGIVSSTLFLGFGIDRAVDDQDVLFSIRAHELGQEFNRTWNEYIFAALWVNQACSFNPMTRNEFKRVFHFVNSQVDVESIQWIPKVLHENRQTLEQESLQYFETHYPEIKYRGIIGFEPIDPNDPNSTSVLQYRSIQDFYHPINLVEPIDAMNAVILDLDVVTDPHQNKALKLALNTFEPTATEHYHRLTPGGNLTEESFIQLFHPGIPLPETLGKKPQDVSAIVVRIKNIVETATRQLPEALSFFLYDTTDNPSEGEFILGAQVYTIPLEETGERIVYLDEISYSELLEETVVYIHVTNIKVASRTWTMVAVALEDTFVPDIRYIILAGKFILVASLCVSLWIMTNYRRTKTVLEVKRKADMEKTAVIVRSARENAKAEQELNDYIAHEIRNPLAAAMSACTFVKSAVNEQNLMATPESLQAIREDVEIIDSSLAFTYDLLRSMLDMHRAACKSLIVEETPLDVLRDIIEPVVAMLYKRNIQFELKTECPPDLYILSDRLRLKQILLNLCRNSARYVQKGYIKVGACVVHEKIQFYVEDSGYGISETRRKNLFSKFQESLEVMDQGSGVGLCLCKSMANLLRGDIWLDENFDSGVEGFVGSRFVIGLDRGPMHEKDMKATLTFLRDYSETDATHEETFSTAGTRSESFKSQPVLAEKRNSGHQECASVKIPTHNLDPITVSHPGAREESTKDPSPMTVEIPTLPESLSILFVDDDMILRKLFMRSVRKVVNSWDIQEAASGEAALKMTDQKEFDIIFMDQYMASVEKKLLGTETVHALRSKGVRSRICGLSANNVEEGFWNAGADAFMLKPFPCKKDQLEQELNRILLAPRNPSIEEFGPISCRGVVAKSNDPITQHTVVSDESKVLTPLEVAAAKQV